MDNITINNGGVIICPETLFHTIFFYLFIILTIILIPAFLFGNALIIAALCKYTRQLKGSMYMFIGNLSATDIMMALAHTLYVMNALLDGVLEENVYFCVVEKCIASISLLSSALTFTFITIDRSMAVFRPLMHKIHTNTRLKSTIILVHVWILSIGLGAVAVIISVNYSRTDSTCSYHGMIPVWLQYFDVTALNIKIAHSIVITTIIAWKLKKRSEENPGHKPISIKTHIMLRVYVLYGVCWIPYVVIVSLGLAYPDETKYKCIVQFTFMGALINVGVNWLIYGLANPKFRQCFNTLLCGRCRKNQSVQQQKNRTGLSVCNKSVSKTTSDINTSKSDSNSD